jgi:RimJ/RimL family protein N-acetyltransferase
MIELKPHQFSTVFPMFSQTHYGGLVAGTLEGGHPGRVFVDNVEKPQVGLVCTKVGYYFLAGDHRCSDASQSLSQLVRDELAPQQIKCLDDPQILIFFHQSGWKEPLLQAFADLKPIVINKKRMVLENNAEENTKNWRKQIPEGMRILPVTIELLEQHPEEARVIELFWGSLKQFEESSLGYWLLDGDIIASSCEAVFVGAREAEISISTPLGYRRRGLARITGSALIETCRKRGLNPIWGCWPENLPSVALARSLGFIDDKEQEIVFFEYHPTD